MKFRGFCPHLWWWTEVLLAPKWRLTSRAALCLSWTEREEVSSKLRRSSMGFTGPVSVFDVGFPPSAAPVSVGRRVQGQKISWWEGQKGLAFLQDVQLVDGELVVPWPGLYYVYAQTYFRHTHSMEETEEEGGEEGDRGRPLLQYVYKKVSIWFNY